MMDMRRDAYRVRFGLSRKQARWITDAVLLQLHLCRSDEIRRLLLGISR